MRPWQRGSSGWRRALAGFVLALSAGCAQIPGLDRALLADRTPAAHCGDLCSRYVVHCPDVLAVTIDGRAEWSGERAVGPEGRIWLDANNALRVDGLTIGDITVAAVHQLRLPPEAIHVRVAKYNSQQIYLFGEVSGLQQAVAYQGPETILDLLQRVGGVTTGAAPRDVQVVRSHVADGKTPEVFKVDLAAIVLHHEQQSNLTLEPFDKIYIGETRQCKLSKCLAPWLRSFYESIWDMRRQPHEPVS